MKPLRATLCCTILLFASHVTVADDLPVTGAPQAQLAAFDKLMLTFMKDHEIPGASLAIARHGHLIYARGFGYANQASREAVQPQSLFRIASISKPFTSAAILQLVERGKLRLDDHPFPLLGLVPHLESDTKIDPRLDQITIRQLLHHSGGFDRDASFDPMFRPFIIAKALGTPPPAQPSEIIRYMMGRPLDFDPGTKEAYSNFGYCVLGRVIEKVSGVSYEAYVRKEVLAPLGIHDMRLGRSLEKDITPSEVHYYPHNTSLVRNVYGPGNALWCYGGWNLEAMDSHGGWIASASDLALFASSLDDPDHCPILNHGSITEMFRRPKDTGYTADGKPKAAYYADGWEVRPVGRNQMNTWHAGLLDGTSTLLVRRYDGLTWAVLFNTDRDRQNHTLADLIDPLLHPVADQIKEWPPEPKNSMRH
jgi:CubicO group peptidase (beta-lactamase class C family)